jgi:4-amino-4-deoxy-L-arabinose transferase-like glycosyltransferase
MFDFAATNPAKRRRLPDPLIKWWTQARSSYFWMFATAFVLRIVFIFALHRYKFRTVDDHFNFGWEMGRIGRSLALGQGFANPFVVNSGPTAWQPPVYPFLVASVFKLFGVYTPVSAIVLLGVNSIFSALTCIPIFLIAKRCFTAKVAFWSAWMWALLPLTMYWCTLIIWETLLSALLLSVIFLRTLSAEGQDGWKPGAVLGLLWGAVALTNTSLLAFLPPSGLWIWLRRWKAGKRSLGGVILAFLIFVACISPWIVRDYRVFGRFIFIRANLGAELSFGNSPGADGTDRSYLHPTRNAYEMRRYEQLGELGYVDAQRELALHWIREDYSRFFWLSVRRFVYFWAGIPKAASIPALTPFRNSFFLGSSVLGLWGLGRMLRKRKPGAWLFFWLILLCPAVYYFVFPLPRYRHPIEPELLILIVFVISEAQRRRHIPETHSSSAL